MCGEYKYPDNIEFRRRAFYVEDVNSVDIEIYMTPEEAKKLGVLDISVTKKKLIHDGYTWMCKIEDEANGLVFFGISRFNRELDHFYKPTTKAYAHSRASLMQQLGAPKARTGLWTPGDFISEMGVVDKQNWDALVSAFNEGNFEYTEEKPKVTCNKLCAQAKTCNTAYTVNKCSDFVKKEK